MRKPHYFHAVARLLGGGVLVIGGLVNDGLDGFASASVEQFDPDRGTWSAVADMTEPRWGHTATLLSDGRVLVAGSHVQGLDPRATAELYDPIAESWAATGKMQVGRGGHTATPLSDGTVLVAGGYSPASPDGLVSAELYDASSGSWRSTSSMGSARQGQTATLLADGRVLVVGGGGEVSFAEGPTYSATAEVYDPRTGRWTPTGSMNMARSGHSASLLPSGHVLVAGGSVGDEATAQSAELYDPGTGVWTLTSIMSIARTGHTATVLADGRLLVAGGVGLGSDPPRLASAELYDPSRGTWTDTPTMARAGFEQTATLLLDGRVLVVGDYDVDSQGAAALYEP